MLNYFFMLIQNQGCKYPHLCVVVLWIELATGIPVGLTEHGHPGTDWLPCGCIEENAVIDEWMGNLTVSSIKRLV